MARAPWSPTGIALVTLVLSPVAGAVLHALNYARLGWPQRRRLSLFSNLITPLVFVLGDMLGSGRRPHYVVTLFLAAYFYKTQAPSFEQHRAAGGSKASLVLPVLLVIVAGVTLGVILVLVDMAG